MARRRRACSRLFLVTLALAVGVPASALVPAATLAHHVGIRADVSAKLGERLSDTAWSVEVSWSVACDGADSAFYTGNLNLIDEANGETIYMGGVFSGSGTARQAVSVRTTARHVKPHLKISCGSNADLHGAGPIEVTGNAVTVPARGDDDGGGGGGGGGSGGGGDGGGGGGPGGLPSGACAHVIRGTQQGETIVGTGRHELVRALGGNDIARGRGGHDCLYGGGGNDRLDGGAGSDGLYGGGGADVLVGGPGVNSYEAGPGDDVVRAANGRAETVDCGGGRDVVAADRADRLVGCERVTRVG